MGWFGGYALALGRYATFSGRAGRAEFWGFVLGNLLALAILGGVDTLLDLTQPPWLGVLTIAYTAAIVVPCLAATVRRLHDIGRSAWWMLLMLVPVLGEIALLLFSVRAGQRGENQFGPEPGRGR